MAIFAFPPKLAISVFWDRCFPPFFYETSVNTQKSTFTPIAVMIYAKATIHAKKRFAVFCTSPKKVYFSVLRLLMHLFVGLCKKATHHGNDSNGNVIIISEQRSCKISDFVISSVFTGLYTYFQMIFPPSLNSNSAINNCIHIYYTQVLYATFLSVWATLRVSKFSEKTL
jgi:hypothetical protein